MTIIQMDYERISKSWMARQTRNSEVENRIRIFPNIHGSDGIHAYCGFYRQIFKSAELSSAIEWVEDNAVVVGELKEEAETFALLRTTSVKEAWGNIGAYGRVLARTSQRITALQDQLKAVSAPTLSSYDTRPNGD